MLRNEDSLNSQRDRKKGLNDKKNEEKEYDDGKEMKNDF